MAGPFWRSSTWRSRATSSAREDSGNWGCRDVVAAGLQPLDDGAPAGAVGPRSVHKDDIRLIIHISVIPVFGSRLHDGPRFLLGCSVVFRAGRSRFPTACDWFPGGQIAGDQRAAMPSPFPILTGRGLVPSGVTSS